MSTKTTKRSTKLGEHDMPMEQSSSKAATERNFREFGKGKTYARTKRKFGKKRADKQRIAAVLHNKRKSKKRHKGGR